MRIWIFGGAMLLGLAAPATAADDDVVHGFLAACQAGDSVCQMDVLSGLQQAIYAQHACPAPDKEARDITTEVANAIQDAVTKTPAVANQKTNDAVIGVIQTLYPCPPPGAAD